MKTHTISITFIERKDVGHYRMGVDFKDATHSIKGPFFTVYENDEIHFFNMTEIFKITIK